MTTPLKGAPREIGAFLGRVLKAFEGDARLVAVAVAGSVGAGRADEWSDLDVVVVVEDGAFDAVMVERWRMAGSVGKLLACFTGEHVGEPRLLICLYEDPLLHVDLKFVRVGDVGQPRVDDPVIIWDRDGRTTEAMGLTRGVYSCPDAQWVEDRFWVWIHYATLKLGRGEWMEAADFLGWLRGQVLGPLAKRADGREARGVRLMERELPAWCEALRLTYALPDRVSVSRAIVAAAAVYDRLRAIQPPRELREAARSAALAFLAKVVEMEG